MNMHSLLWFGKRILCSNFKNTLENVKNCSNAVVSQTKNDIPAVTIANQFDVLSNIVTPWWQVDYAEQLLRKKKWTRAVVERIKSNRIPRCKTRIHEIVPSPIIESYRNKDEFSIRRGIDGNDKTVGFFVGSPAEGITFCVQPTKLITLKESHILLSEAFQNLIRDSPLKACYDLNDGGYWRNLIVRSNRKGEVMLIVMAHPLGASKAAIEYSKELIKERLLSTEFNITSLYFQACPNVRCTNAQAPFELLHGDKYMYETIHDITIRLSPDSYFQVNTEASEMFYSAILNFVYATNKTTVLDLCSGMGIVSLIASRRVRGCVGIESIESAVDDANFNAKYNEITNCLFISGRLEKNLKSVIKQLDLASEILPVLSPGRDGISKQIVSTLRNTVNITRLIYVTGKADSQNIQKNFHDLCSPSFHKSAPFILSDVQPVDMFPQTEHCELILVFKR